MDYERNRVYSSKRPLEHAQSGAQSVKQKLDHTTKKTIPVQRPVMKLTSEQELIIKCNDQIIYVQAFAGSGKTSTLVEYCKRRPNEKFLYIPFNKSVQEKAIEKFPKNVDCRTFDSMCFVVSASFDKKCRDFNVNLIKEVCPEISKDAKMCRKVFKLLKKFCTSADVTKVEACIPTDKYAASKNVIGYAKKVWEKALDGSSTWFCHDVNKKVALLKNEGKAIRNYLKKYGTILIDECQDVNSIMLAIFDTFKKKKIFIGDSHQAIYSFMGCVNVFERDKSVESLRLTQSFRFGNEIAERADWIISFLKDPAFVPAPLQGVKGTGNQTRIVDQLEGKYTVLARTNRTLFQEAYNHVTNGCLVFWEGFNEVSGKINYISTWYNNKEVWNQKKEQAEKDDDWETVGYMNLIESEGIDMIRTKLDAIRNGSSNEKSAMIILSTVHKAKGLEWDQVKVCSDIANSIQRVHSKCKDSMGDIIASIIPADYKIPSKLLAEYIEECNIYYVAITRSMKCLMDNSFGVIQQISERLDNEIL